MSVRERILRTAGGLGAGAVAALATGLVVERQVVRQRRAGSAGASRFSALSAPPTEVVADDGVRLHAEVDPREPYGEADPRPDEPTLVFVHGYALNLHCWHFQREAFRGKYRMVFYDQRSHGRSDRSPLEHATIDQLGDDLAVVIRELAPRGPVVVVGHSMGGMTIMALAERHPRLFKERVSAVALLSTTAGGLHPHRVLSRLIPDRIGDLATPRVIAGLAKAPQLVDSARRGSNIGFVAARQFAFGGDVPAEEVEFVDEMLAGTSMTILAEFFPTFGELDKFAVLRRLGRIPVLILCGTADRITSIGHSRKMAGWLPHARLVESQGTGHMVIMEDRDRVNAEIVRLVEEGVG